VTTLHTVNKHSLNSDLLSSCLRVARAGDCILLIEDGIYNVRTLEDLAAGQG
jgi:sulfur relay protein TusB/DsrH